MYFLMQRSDLHWGPLLHSNPKMSVANAEKFNYCLLWSSWANIWVTSAPFLLGLLTNVTTQELYPDKELNKEQRTCFQTNPRVTGELPPAHPSSKSAAAANHHTLFLPATATSTNNFWCSNWGRDPHFSPVTRGRADTLYANSKITCEQTPWSGWRAGPWRPRKEPLFSRRNIRKLWLSRTKSLSQYRNTSSFVFPLGQSKSISQATYSPWSL